MQFFSFQTDRKMYLTLEPISVSLTADRDPNPRSLKPSARSSHILLRVQFCRDLQALKITLQHQLRGLEMLSSNQKTEIMFQSFPCWPHSLPVVMADGTSCTVFRSTVKSLLKFSEFILQCLLNSNHPSS